jgi:Xaa-Pro dipeptidase
VRENDIVAEVSKFLYTRLRRRRAINAIPAALQSASAQFATACCGQATRLLHIRGFMGYRTCCYRTFNVGRATRFRDARGARMARQCDRADQAGVSTDKVCSVWPRPEFGFPDEMSAFGLQFGTASTSLYERPHQPRHHRVHPDQEAWCSLKPVAPRWLFRRAHRGGSDLPTRAAG